MGMWEQQDHPPAWYRALCFTAMAASSQLTAMLRGRLHTLHIRSQPAELQC
jgi:hypothetical protein